MSDVKITARQIQRICRRRHKQGEWLGHKTPKPGGALGKIVYLANLGIRSGESIGSAVLAALQAVSQ